jgi:hypothetical protein
MNFRYFACPVCKKFTSAGYRWAYWCLEHPGLVEPNKPVDIGALLSASEYWQPPLDRDSTWLYEEVFPLVKAFLSEHADHRIIFVESGDFFDREDFDSWVEIEKR